ncbi:MAG: type IV secretion protein Rhs [Burkholderiales bacterium]|nr:MAG: type IV secretion protein Rhs [Burkholderiales bacterium]
MASLQPDKAIQGNVMSSIVRLLKARLLCSAVALVSVYAHADHRDPAPLSDDVVQKIVAIHKTAPFTSSLTDLNKHLDELTQIANTTPGPSHRMLVAGKRHELSITKKAVLKDVDAMRQHLVTQGLSDQVKAWDQLSTQILDRFDRLDKASAAVDDDDEGRRGKALEHLQAELKVLRGDVVMAQMAPSAPVPTWSTSAPLKAGVQYPPSTRKPRFEAQREWPTRYAMAGDQLIAAAPATPPEATSCGYTAADLAATADAPKDAPAIQALAAQLNYSPAQIFQYVYNNVKFEPYFGSLKGALVTLQSMAGGPTDQASLLIALLRASNIPARYVSGTVLVADAEPYALGGRVASWVGAKSYDGAKAILDQGAFGAVTSTLPSWGIPSGVQLNQVWVEACVPYGRYRGITADNSGTRWIPLDPSFKDKSYQSGLSNSQTFDYSGFLSKRLNGSDSLPQEQYALQVEKAVRTNDPNATVQDVPYSGSINPLEMDILPATLPYEVVNYTNWPGTSSPEIAELPDDHRYRLYIGGLNFKQDTTTQDVATRYKNSTFSVAIPDIVSNRLTLSFKGATTGDQGVLNSWQTDGNVSSTSAIPCSVNVVPVIMIEGGTQTLPAPSSATGVGLCTTTNTLTMEVGLKQLAPIVNTDPNQIGRTNYVAYTNIGAANWHALQAYAFQGSDALIAQRAAALTAKVNSTSDPNASVDTLDATQGEFLHLVGLKYMRYITNAASQIGGLDGGSGQSGNHLGLVSSQMKVQYAFDLPFAVNRSGFLVDVRGGQDRGVDLSTGKTVFKTFLLSGYAGSNYESYVWQENAKLDAVSTVRGLQFANETGVGTVSINSGNWSSMRPLLQVFYSPNSSATDCSIFLPSPLEYPRCLIDDPNNAGSILAQVNAGATVTIPKSLIQYSGWKGIVYVASTDNTATDGRASASYAIGPYGGGYSVGPEISVGSFSALSNYDYVAPSIVPTFLSTPTVGTFNNAAPTTLTASNGVTSVSILSGDPVNMVSGNLYHNDTDITIKGRGGLPIVFTRAYNSRNPADGPLGFGWTHNFNAKLKFYGVESGQAKFSWIDGTGAEKFYAAPSGSHTNGNINLNTPIANPPGVFVTLQRLADGTYSVKEKNGLTYKFASATGPSGTPGTGTTPVYAALQSITDRNGNSLTLSYAGSTGCAGGTLLCTVTDSIGHTLSFTYSGIHITQIKDFSGRTYQYGYTDSNNNLTSFSNPLAVAGKQKAVSYSYYTSTDGTSFNHLMKQYTLPRGNGMKFEYYANGRVFRHTVVRTDGTASPDQINLFTYNDFRRETVQTNERLGDKHFFFDPYGNPTKVLEENGAEHSYSYDCIDQTQAPGSTNCLNPYNRLSETNPAGYVTQYAYDSNGNVTQITPPRGTSAATKYVDYNGFGQPRRIQDGNGHWTIQRFNTTGNLTDVIRVVASYAPPSCASAECTVPTAAQVLSWTVRGYDSAGNLTSTKRVRDVAGQIANNTATSNTGPLVTYGFDSNKWNATSISRVGIKNADTSASTVNTATLGYDSLGRLTSGVDADWYSTQFNYDDLDRPYQATDRLGQLRTYQFDANGNAVGQSLTISIAGVSTLVDSSSSRYDDSDRVIQSLDAGGFATAFTYDAAGNVLSITNPDGYVVSFDYDAANRPIHAYDQANNAVTTLRDTGGRTRSVTDPNGNTVTSSYWDATRDGRLKSVTYPLILDNGRGGQLTSGRSIQYDYDAVGNVTSVTEFPALGSFQDNRVTTTTYDELNRPTRIVGPQYTDSTLGAICPVTVNTFDTLGRLINVAAGYTPSPCTTAAGDVTTTQQSYSFDDFGRKIQSTDGLSRSWNYVYDANNNIQSATDPKSQTTTYTWDTGHQLKTRVEQGGRTTSYTRNALGQVLTVTHPNVNYSYAYDAAHRLVTAQDSRGNKTLGYDWSPGGLLNSITDSNNRKTTYLYDPVGRLTGITAPNGDTLAYQFDAGGRLIQRTMPSGLSANFTYNEDNSLHQIVNKDTANDILSQHDYAYDGVGNRVLQAENVGGITISYAYTYDELNRLTQVTNGTDTQQENYTYDALNNRLTKSVGQSSPTVLAYKYDAANQLTEIHTGSASGPLQTTLTYDANGNITGDGFRAYTWDAMDQLTEVTLAFTTVDYTYDDSGRRIQKSTGGVTTKWTYDGQDIYAEYPATWTTPNAVYTSGGATDDPVIRVATTGAATYGTASYYHADGLGSVVGLSNNADNTTQTERFDAWGKKLSGGTIPQSAQYGFTGREPDETGLVYMRERYYNPALARFVSRDPAGTQGGPNAYAYCGNNPTNCTDPSGMLPSFNNTIAQNQFSSYFTSPSMSTGGLSSGFQSLGSQTNANTGLAAAAIALPGGSGLPSLEGLSGGGLSAGGLAAGAIVGAALTSGDTQQPEQQYLTYTRTGPNGQIYSGRTSGAADESIQTILGRRMAGQPILNSEGFSRPVLDQVSTNPDAIRGREQQLIDFNGGAKSVGGTTRNAINGVSDWNINRPWYIYQSVKEFGPLPDNSPSRSRFDPGAFLLQAIKNMFGP